MENKNIKEFLVWSGLVIFLAQMLYILVVDPLLDDISLNKDFAYAITDNVSRGSVGSTGAENRYIFLLNGQQYIGRTRLPLKKDGTKYFIKFYPKKPRRNKATKVIATSEDIKNMPSGGYKELPHK